MAASLKGKSLNSLKKDELIIYIAEQEQRNNELLENMAGELTSLKNEVTLLRDISVIQNDFNSRLVDVERRLSLQEQYSRRECVDVVNIPEEIEDDDLESTVIEVFKTAGVHVQPRDFHAIHRKKNKSIVIAKFVNRRDAIAILRAKSFVRNFNNETKDRLKLDTDKKIYINESLFPSFSRLMAISNQLFKDKKISSFYSVNGLIRVKLPDGGTAPISHLEDLRKLFGRETIVNIMKKHEESRKPKQR